MKSISTILILFTFVTVSVGQCLNNEQEFRSYFKTNISLLDPVEGLWSVTRIAKLYKSGSLLFSKSEPQITLAAVKRSGDIFTVCIANGDQDSSTVELSPTALKGIYLYNKTYLSNHITVKVKGNAILTKGTLLEYSYEENKDELKKGLQNTYTNDLSCIFEYTLLKMYPSENEYQKYIPSSGTGFALSSNGVIVTNHHVINGATNINVRGINGDFSKIYKAKVLIADNNNDLAIIKIDDISFLNLGTIPFVISNRSCDVGCSIFCLGYPLRATMGDEVKLTNGIISAKSGFQGNITTYQITAPIQPGNSGGPLFDNKGELIGVINAKHLGTENVSYAVKVSYLLNLINMMPSLPKLQTINTLKGKMLSDQVKIIRNFTYIIETE